ncbi:hypothetical protein LTR62_004349 [Meristemomyces frigidus]|uniref:DNA mismatch repair protein PMS1 n=1 Tax=Meristemomyces frigidus TaxID=1508187 RepID=A0AAN7THQ9_9PEZI|nr:hypothetical protein LTR62_004349 [Meristemomyces frigidus]
MASYTQSWAEASKQMATIRAIEGRSVHQIQSGQVIVDLNSVVKELVENSLDAGATSIDVRFKNQGLDSVEVQDNGKGISPEDYETVALKHHTSKLASYDDLTTLDTFGFRGEALSSLCALSKFHILTARSEDGAVGKRLDFDISGKLKSTTVAAAQKGTTVSVDEIFYNLPVRRKELEKNSKREYVKVLSLLHAYACISVGVRFSVSNQMPKGKKIAVFSTKSNTTTKENIVNIYGAKTLLALSRLDLSLDMAPGDGLGTQSARNCSTQVTDRSPGIRIEGHISRPVFGDGRQAPDRQMFFVNSRPCLLPQVSKAINEVYKSFNTSQSPFIFANLIMDTNSYDVNVSPDKRTIMLHDQTALLESLKTALTKMFDQTDHTVPQSTLPNRKFPSYQPPNVVRREATAQSMAGDEDGNDFSNASNDEDGNEDDARVPAKAHSIGALPTQPNLINGWLTREAEERKPLVRQRHSDSETDKHKQNLVKYMRKMSDESLGAKERPLESLSQNHDTDEEQSILDADVSIRPPQTLGSHANPVQAFHRTMEPDPMSAPYDDPFCPRPPGMPKQSTKPLVHARSDTADEDIDVQNVSSRSPSLAVKEIAIPAITTSSQTGSPGPVQNAIDRMRPKRTPLQTAEITVGDTTTTTVIGSSSPYKRRRVHIPKDSDTTAKLGGSSLLARFAAAGSQLALERSDLSATALPRPLAHASHSESDNEENEDDAQCELRKDVAEYEKIDKRTPDPLDELIPAAIDDDNSDEDYVDEAERRIHEDEKVAQLIHDAEVAATRPSEANLRRALQLLKNGGTRKEATLNLMHTIDTSIDDINKQIKWSSPVTERPSPPAEGVHGMVNDELNDSNAEGKLSLTVTKADFERMIIVGQFNLGFILAVRPSSDEGTQDELFIIDQHAADEKYNYERLQRTVTLQGQRLARPKCLDLTAVEEEIILNNPAALKANGFEIETTTPDIAEDKNNENQQPPTSSFRLLTLPTSGKKTFAVSDLEELLHLLSETPTGSTEIPRPKQVQRMLAMHACRSSIMVGKTLTAKQMRRVAAHMGEMDKPWNCPHGRPTMRHLAGLGGWEGWGEGCRGGDEERRAVGGGRTDWGAWLEGRM